MMPQLQLRRFELRARSQAVVVALGLCAAGCSVDEADLAAGGIDANASASFEGDRELRDQGTAPEVSEGSTAGPGVAYAVTLRTVYGYVRDTAGQPMVGFSVEAFDADDLDDDDIMGSAVTDATGYFEIHYDGGHWDPCPHEWDCWRPDVYVAVSSSQWVNHGKVYAGNWDGLRPLCSQLEYVSLPIAFSTQRADWRLRDPLRIDVTTPPRDEVWEAPTARPPCLASSSFCYSFTSLHSECFGVVERLQGCTTSGQQFEWFAGCLFVSSSSPVGYDMYGTYVGSTTMCFPEPLPWPPADCTRGASLRPVDPQPTFLTAAALDD